jgi:hypothetical protein
MDGFFPKTICTFQRNFPMKKMLFIPALLLCAAFAFGQHPSRPSTLLMDQSIRSGSTDADFGAVTEQSSGPVVCDLDNDGQPEVILTGRTEIWVVNYANPDPATPVFHMLAQSGYQFNGPVTVAHLSADGYPWLVIGASDTVHYAAGQCPGISAGDEANKHRFGDCYHWRSVLQAWKIVDGDTLGIRSAPIDTMRLTTPCAADADGDGVDELCFVGSSSYGSYLGSETVRFAAAVRFFKLNGAGTSFDQMTTSDPNDQVVWYGRSIDIGMPSRAFPVTPPCVRVSYTAVR